VLKDVRGSTYLGRHDRQAVKHAFQDNHPEGFVAAGHGEHVRGHVAAIYVARR